MRSKKRPLVFEKSVSSLPAIPSPSRPLRVAVVGNHLPRQCGIATFTTDLCDAIAIEYGAAGVFVVAVNDPQSRYSYPARVRFELSEGDLSSYKAAADFLNSSNVDLVCLQHEYVIELLDNDAGRQAMRERAYANSMPPARMVFPLQAAERNATSRLINV